MNARTNLLGAYASWERWRVNRWTHSCMLRSDMHYGQKQMYLGRTGAEMRIAQVVNQFTFIDHLLCARHFVGGCARSRRCRKVYWAPTWWVRYQSQKSSLSGIRQHFPQQPSQMGVTLIVHWRLEDSKNFSYSLQQKSSSSKISLRYLVLKVFHSCPLPFCRDSTGERSQGRTVLVVRNRACCEEISTVKCKLSPKVLSPWFYYSTDESEGIWGSYGPWVQHSEHQILSMIDSWKCRQTKTKKWLIMILHNRNFDS